MLIAGVFLTIVLFFGGFALAEMLFYYYHKRFFWRAFVPSMLRFTIYPDDKVELDCYDILTEYGTLMLYCSSMVFPLMALNFMGFVKIF